VPANDLFSTSLVTTKRSPIDSPRIVLIPPTNTSRRAVKMSSPASQSVSKSAKKKAAKAIERVNSPAPSAASGAAEKNSDDGPASQHIRELQKNIRNLNKKLTNASKTDSILNEHPKKTLDELVSEKIINADQKAQIEKKPELRAQLQQQEEQLNQYIKIDEHYRSQATADKAEWEKTLEKAKSDAAAEVEASFRASQRKDLLLLSQFLRLAAYRREEGGDAESDESQAIEGILLAIYTGDDSAVETMLKLTQGSSDAPLSVPGEQLQTPYSQIKTLAQTYKSPYEIDAAAETSVETEAATDPTVAHATTTEIEAGDATQLNGQSVEAITSGIDNVNVTDQAANAVGQSHWDSTKDVATSQDEWVQVPRDPSETDTGLNATPAVAANTQSWADDHPEQKPAPKTADPNEGFQSVQRNRGRTDGGPSRGGRGRGDFRGRGRGDARGRGRGGRGGPSRGGPRRTEES